MFNVEYSAKLCQDYESNGYSDWFLPSRDELKLMYINLKVQGLGGFSKDRYWSSSDRSAYSTWYQSFDSWEQDRNGRGSVVRVKPMRAF